MKTLLEFAFTLVKNRFKYIKRTGSSNKGLSTSYFWLGSNHIISRATIKWLCPNYNIIQFLPYLWIKLSYLDSNYIMVGIPETLSHKNNMVIYSDISNNFSKHKKFVTRIEMYLKYITCLYLNNFYLDTNICTLYKHIIIFILKNNPSLRIVCKYHGFFLKLWLQTCFVWLFVSSVWLRLNWPCLI